MKKNVFLVLISMIMVGTLFATGRSDSASSSNVAQDFIYAVDAEPSGLDPHLNTAAASIRVHRQIYSKLLDTDRNMNFVPDLAARWEEGPNNTYTFYLRRGVKFHNGRELVAADVVYSYERMKDPNLGSVARSYFASVNKIEAVDNYTVRFTLSNPDAMFLMYTTSNYAAIVPREVVEANGNLNNVTCGTGPYKFKEQIPGNRVVLEKNPDYFIAGEPRLNTLTFVVMPEASARLNALRTGAIHLAVLPPSNLPLVKGNNDIVVMDYLSVNIDYLGFNLTKPPFNDVRVRQAVSLLIDRKEIIDTIYDGNAEMTGPVPASLKKWTVDVTKNEFYTPNVDRARTLLRDAGYPNGFDMKIIAGISQETTNEAQLIVSQLAKGGIRAEIIMMETSQYVAAWRAASASDSTLQTMIGYNGGGSDPDRGINLFFRSDSSTNVWGYKNARIDQLVVTGLQTTDFDKRYDIYKEAQDIILRELPNLFIVSPKAFVFARSNVVGYIADTYYSENFTGVSLK